MKNNPTNITSEGASKKLVPELRFPEFVNEGEWVSTSLGNKCINVFSGKNKVKKKKGEFPVYGSTGIIGYSDSFVYGFPTILVARVGANAGLINKVTGKYDVTDNTIIIQLCNDCDIDYVYYFLASIDINKLIFGSGQPLITSSLLKKTNISIPSFAEQQKIAQCLSSLDELIAAKKEKVELLKEHKRGLMQKLFPAKGKTLPELRFPEFKNEGEWEEQMLGDCLSQTPDYGLNAPAIPYSLLKPTYLRITDIDDNGRFITEKKMSVETEITEKNSLTEGDIVFARTGASVGKVYKYRVEDGPLVFAGFLIRVRPNISKYSSEFIFQYLFTDIYKRWVQVTSARSGQPGINSNEYASLRIPFPNLAEQQKIAQCLSSLDELITETKEKVKALELYKKGLMQKLFPKT